MRITSKTSMFTMNAFLAVLLCGLVTAANAQGLVTRYVAGEHYQAIDEPVVQTGDDIRVVEFFLYSCPHCYSLEADVTEWHESLDEDVVFDRVPVLFGANGPIYARMFYTAQELGVLERLHPEIFTAIHERRQPLATPDVVRAFFVAHGVDADRFDSVFNSDAIDQKINEAGELMRAFRVMAVPSLGVAGKYWVTGRMAGGNDALFSVADYLIERERRAQNQ